MNYSLKQAKVSQMIAMDALRNDEPQKAASYFRTRRWWMKEARKSNKSLKAA